MTTTIAAAEAQTLHAEAGAEYINLHDAVTDASNAAHSAHAKVMEAEIALAQARAEWAHAEDAVDAAVDAVHQLGRNLLKNHRKEAVVAFLGFDPTDHAVSAGSEQPQ